MNEAWNAPENGYPISRFALWAWILSFGCTFGNIFVRIALWSKGREQGAWTLSILAAAAAVAFLLHIRRDRRAALALSIGVGVYELLNQGLYLYSSYLANEDPESLRRMLHLLSSGHWWVYRHCAGTDAPGRYSASVQRARCTSLSISLSCDIS